MAYTKLDSGITESTIWQAADPTRLVWITMLARADQHGYVGASMPGLASLARVSLADCVAAIAHLESPDEWSRTKDHEGRRIAPADGGWVLLNHAKYRAKQNADDRRERSRVAMAELRKSRKQLASVNDVAPGCAKLTQAEAEAKEDKKPPPLRGVPPCPEDVTAEVWADWLALRRAKRAPVTATTVKGARAEAHKAGMTFEAFLVVWCRRGSQGLEASWLQPDERAPQAAPMTIGSKAPDQTAAYLESQRQTPEQRAASDAARRETMAKLRKVA